MRHWLERTGTVTKRNAMGEGCFRCSDWGRWSALYEEMEIDGRNVSENQLQRPWFLAFLGHNM